MSTYASAPSSIFSVSVEPATDSTMPSRRLHCPRPVAAAGVAGTIVRRAGGGVVATAGVVTVAGTMAAVGASATGGAAVITGVLGAMMTTRSEEHTSELQSRLHLVCRLLLEKKKSH